MSLFDVRDLSVQLALPDRTIYPVDQVSFSIDAGETVGLVGESGSGKTMIGSAIMRLLPPSGRIVGGSISLGGNDLAAMTERDMRRVRGNQVSMVFQDPMTSLNPTTTIGRQIAEPLVIHGLAGRDKGRARVLELLDLVGIPRPAERIGNYPHQLSGGLRQRVMIAIALACEPQLLIADEPTTALDVSIQDQILSLLERLKQDLKMAVLLITHDMGVIAGHADRVLVMYGGRIAEQASTVELFDKPRHRYTEALLESLPSLEQDPQTALYSIPGLPPALTSPATGCRFAPRCRFASERCIDELPATTHSSPTHTYACFHPLTPSADAIETQELPERVAPMIAARRGDVLVSIADVVREFPVRSSMGRSLGSIKAVSDVSLEVFRGETLGLVGESGCGKTTLGRMLVALEKPDAGTITVDGDNLFRMRGRTLRQRRRDVQMVFQDPFASLDPRMRVETIVSEPLAVQRGISSDVRRGRVAELLSEVGLSEAAARLFPREFSGGQRQRIGIARALAATPKLIVADEPVSALDISIRSQLLNLLRRLQTEHELTLVMISHDLSVVRYLADRVAVMYLGKLVEVGPTASVYDETVHPYTAGLLEAIPVPDPSRTGNRRSAAVRGELPSALEPPSGCRFRTRCPRAIDRCASEEPLLRPFGDTGHLAACHVPLRDPLPLASATS